MRVFSVPLSAPFLRSVIAALIDGRLVAGFEARTEPAALSRATLYLPTRRAVRAAREVFLDVLARDAVLLPRMVALGDIDEDEIAFAGVADETGGAAALDIPPKLGELQRRLTLATLVAAWAKGEVLAPLSVGGPAATLALASDLARLIDDMVTRNVAWDALDGLVPDQLDQHWQHSLQFLQIARKAWPDYLKEIGRIEPAARRDLLIAAEASRLRTHRAGPVVAAGSTGSMPATASFLHAVATLANGAVVLPGLDTDLDEDAWQAIGGVRNGDGKIAAPAASSHPQLSMHALLRQLGMTRGDVGIVTPPTACGRDALMSEVMRPSHATGHWHERLAEPGIAERVGRGLRNLAVIEAPNPDMEALAIAVAMREAEHLQKTAALVTPDRTLARRVMAALARFNLDVDDSGGDALLETPAGIFARLAAEAVAKELEPATLLALLKHPLFRLSRRPRTVKEAVEALELALLRGPRPRPGSGGLAEELARVRDELCKLRAGAPSSLHGREPRARLTPRELDSVHSLIGSLSAALAPLEGLAAADACDFVALAARHREVLIALARDADGTVPAFAGEDGTALMSAFDEVLSEQRDSGFRLRLDDYPDVFATAFAGRVVRRPERPGARLKIYGPLESRLMEADRVIAGGLNEGVWPPAPRIDPWLSRPMRHALGLDLPERRIGLSAHDFAQLFAADEVILTHATKADGAPSVASRFLHRLAAVAGVARLGAARHDGARYLRLAHELDRAVTVEPVRAPAPRPPRAARPLRLPVTAIEDWLRDPYTIYARYVLRLDRLAPVDQPLSAADNGSAIHAALGELAKTYPTTLPDHPARVLREIGAKHFAPLMARPEARALWWPRFERIAAWLAEWEAVRRKTLVAVKAEATGEIRIKLDEARSFVLSARADRIERRHDGDYAIVDYKTGQPPTDKQVWMGLAPQLTLEAAILNAGGFEGIAAGARVAELAYVRLSGNTPPGAQHVLQLKLSAGGSPQAPDTVAGEALRKLTALVLAFDDETRAYESLSLPMWSNRYGAYDDLARIKEWSAAGGVGVDEW